MLLLRFVDDLRPDDFEVLGPLVDELLVLVARFVFLTKVERGESAVGDPVNTGPLGGAHMFEEVEISQMWEAGVDIATIAIESSRDVHPDIPLTVAKSLQNVEICRASQLHHLFVRDSHAKIPLVSDAFILSVHFQSIYLRYK